MLQLPHERRLQLAHEGLGIGGVLQADLTDQALIGELMDHAVDVPEVSDSKCHAFYDKHPGKFRGPDLFAPCHILFAAPPGNKEARATAKKRAVEVLADLDRRPDAFARIARTSSGCPSGASGGSLGQITRGETMPEFEQALEALRPDEICQHPVETEHGFHVIKLEDRVPGAPLPFNAVRDRIMIYLRDEAWRAALHAYILELARPGTVENFSLAEAPAELPAANERGLRLLQ